MDKKHLVSVAGLVTNANSEVLLVKSPNPLRGWEFPGGMVEPGETLQEALLREIFEESGINVDITAFVGAYTNVTKDIVNLDFRCRYVSGVPTTSDESMDVGWFPANVAVRMMEDPMYEVRLINMLASNGKMYCYAFRQNPFVWTVKEEFPVGQ